MFSPGNVPHHKSKMSCECRFMFISHCGEFISTIASEKSALLILNIHDAVSFISACNLAILSQHESLSAAFEVRTGFKLVQRASNIFQNLL